MTTTQIDTIHDAIAEHRLQHRITFEDRWISEAEKIERLASALAVAYLPQNEDSYGYCSLEAAHACKAILTTTDSGGVLELITDGRNGIIVAPDAQALAEAMDRLYLDREQAARLGEANKQALSQLGIEWPTVIKALTS